MQVTKEKRGHRCLPLSVAFPPWSLSLTPCLQNPSLHLFIVPSSAYNFVYDIESPGSSSPWLYCACFLQSLVSFSHCAHDFSIESYRTHIGVSIFSLFLSILIYKRVKSLPKGSEGIMGQGGERPSEYNKWTKRLFFLHLSKVHFAREHPLL